MLTSKCIPVVWAIIEKTEWDKKFILLQTRYKPGTEFHETLETPTWWLDEWENVYDGLVREIKEECNLEVTHINKQDRHVSDMSQWFSPFYCTQQRKVWLSWLMLWFVCRCIWTLSHQESETRDPHWVEIKDVETLLEGGKVFPLQVPFFRYYLENHIDIQFEGISEYALT